MVAPSGGGAGDNGGAALRPVPGGRGFGKVKGSWTPEEDDLLRSAVARHGPRNWSVISAEIPGRSGKSCRLRWCNQLNPDVERRPFTPEEDALIVAAHAQYGNKWATIARMLHGRTDNSVKNHWNSTLRRRRRAAAAAAAAAGSGPPGPGLLRHLLTSDQPAPAASSFVPFQPLDLKREREDDGDEDDDDEEDEDGSSEDSVLMPPPKKRPCLAIGAAHAHPSSPCLVGAAKTPAEHTKPLQPATPPAPPEPLTSLTLSLPGGGGGAVPAESPALPQGAAAPAVASMDDGVAKMRAKLEQEWPWLVPVMRQMICEEVRRHLQGANVPSLLVASPADGRAPANGPD